MLARIVGRVMLGCMAVAGFAPQAAMAEERNILKVLWRGETEAEKAFGQRLEELGIKASYTVVNAEQDRGKLAEAMRAVEADITAGKYDLIYAHGTSGAQVTQSVVNDRVPVVFAVVYDPVSAKLVKSMDAPGVNMTGVTNGVPIEDQFSAIQKLRPIKNLCVLFNAREANSNIIEKRVSDWAKANSVPMTSHRVAANSDALDRVLEEVKAGKVSCDVAYAGADSYLATQATKINDAIGDKVILFGGTETFVLRGWAGAYATSVEDMGTTAAESAARIFKGESAATIPVVLPAPQLILTESVANRFGIAVPADAVKR